MIHKGQNELTWEPPLKEVERLKALLDLQHKALKYAADQTKPDDLMGCNCLICEAIHAYNIYRGIEK